MHLTNRTLSILKNFQGIHKSLTIHPGSFLSTISPNRDILALAKVEEVFPVEVNIWDLSRFLQVIQTMNNPEIEWFDDHAVLKSGESSMRFIYSEGTTNTPPSVDVILGYADSEFSGSLKVAKEEYKTLVQMGNTLSDVVEEVRFSLSKKAGARIELSAAQQKKNRDSFDIKYPTAEVVEDIDVSVDFNSMKLIPSDYDVMINQLMVMFANEDNSLTYFLLTKEDDM